MNKYFILLIFIFIIICHSSYNHYKENVDFAILYGRFLKPIDKPEPIKYVNDMTNITESAKNKINNELPTNSISFYDYTSQIWYNLKNIYKNIDTLNKKDLIYINNIIKKMSMGLHVYDSNNIYQSNAFLSLKNLKNNIDNNKVNNVGTIMKFF